MFDFLPFFFPSFLLTTVMFASPPTEEEEEETFLCHGLLTFAARKPLLPFALQNPLDCDSGYCRPENKPFGDL